MSSNNNMNIMYGTRNHKTMFITNLPPHMDSQDLRKICEQVGTVADLYMPRKLSNSGKRFAFVTFLLLLRRRVQEEDDASELARKLNAIWIGSYHLFATLARHQEKPFYQSQQTTRKQGRRNFNNNRLRKTCCWKMKQEDRISALPDCLLLEILSRLPSTLDAIITCTLSKRWQHLWTWLPTLKFSNIDYDIYDLPMSGFVSFVNKTLTRCRQLNLKQFHVTFINDDTKYYSQVNNWICYAIRCNVGELYVDLSDEFSQELRVQYQPFFISSCFTHLRVSGCQLNPVGPISWKNLKSLSISYARLDQDVIENILSGSPLLETLALKYCYGYRRLDITSKILKKLMLACSCVPRNINIEINAPNISSITIENYDRFNKPLLVDVSSLVQANLQYDIELPEYNVAVEEENLKEFILNFPNVKELKIRGFQCVEVASRLEAKGFVFPSNMEVIEMSRIHF